MKTIIAAKGRSEPADIAKVLFRMNYCQAVGEAASEQTLNVAVKELETRGFRKANEQGI